MPASSFILAITSIGVYGISLGGWASGSKYPLLGSIRATAQMISYELAMSLSFVGVLILAGTTSLDGIVHAQLRWWFFVPQFVGFLIYMITAVAETNRTPFDLGRSRDRIGRRIPHRVLGAALRAVFHRGVREYVDGLVHCDAAVLRRMERAVRADDGAGSHLVPIKVACFMFFYIWLRATLPRLRYDRLMAFGWKVLLPVATLNLMVTAASSR